MSTPRTIRLKNPFALIQAKPSPWKGYVRSEGNFLEFDSVENGARAGMINLINTYLLRGRDTIGEIIPVYAPEPEVQKIENYMAFLENKTGMKRDEPIKTAEQFLRLAKAITWFEAGKDWIPESTIKKAYNQAIESTGFSSFGKISVASFRLGIVLLMGGISYALYKYIENK